MSGRGANEQGAAGRPFLLVLVGTDHHPFDRVVTWVDEWLEAQTDPPEAFVQHGTARPPRVAGGVPMTDKDELGALMARADVVVSHGGPATITEIRRHGRLPVVVPRDPALGEHVDGHQQRFARRMGTSGFVVTCETREDLHARLDDALADPSTLAVDAGEETVRLAASVQRFADVVDPLVRNARSRRAPRPIIDTAAAAPPSGRAHRHPQKEL